MKNVPREGKKERDSMNLEVNRGFWRNQILNLPVHVNGEKNCEKTSARDV